MKISHIAATFLLLSLASVQARETMPDDSRAAFDRVGVPIYPGAVYCIGDSTNGIRLATSDSQDAVRAWYIDKLSEWNLFDDFGLWILADSPPGSSMSDLMSGNNIVVDVNADLPQWHGLASDMTTQIVVALPRVPSDSPGGPLLTIPPGEMPDTGESIQDRVPMEVTGALGSGEDMEFGLGRYFYIQDENYVEYPVVYTDGMSRDTENKLGSIETAYEKVRIKGRVLMLQDGRVLGFDRDVPIEIFEEP